MNRRRLSFGSPVYGWLSLLIPSLGTAQLDPLEALRSE